MPPLFFVDALKRGCINRHRDLPDPLLVRPFLVRLKQKFKVHMK